MGNFLSECPCGSGLPAEGIYDCMGIFVFWACDECLETQKKKYDPVIWNDRKAYQEKIFWSGEEF